MAAYRLPGAAVRMTPVAELPRRVEVALDVRAALNV
jgi:hypothetical protein